MSDEVQKETSVLDGVLEKTADTDLNTDEASLEAEKISVAYERELLKSFSPVKRFWYSEAGRKYIFTFVITLLCIGLIAVNKGSPDILGDITITCIIVGIGSGAAINIANNIASIMNARKK